jgi:hypothetical protein
MRIALFVCTVLVTGLGIACGIAGGLEPPPVLAGVALAEFVLGVAATISAANYLSQTRNVSGVDYVGASLGVVIGMGGAVFTVVAQFASLLKGGGH